LSVGDRLFESNAHGAVGRLDAAVGDACDELRRASREDDSGALCVKQHVERRRAGVRVDERAMLERARERTLALAVETLLRLEVLAVPAAARQAKLLLGKRPE